MRKRLRFWSQNKLIVVLIITVIVFHREVHYDFLFLTVCSDKPHFDCPPPPASPAWGCLQSRFTGAAFPLAKEQISITNSSSFWMNDLLSQLRGCLHQTWPTLIINDRAGQCPIFTTESSVMPAQTKAPRVSSFSTTAHIGETEKKTFIC